MADISIIALYIGTAIIYMLGKWAENLKDYPEQAFDLRVGYRTIIIGFVLGLFAYFGGVPLDVASIGSLMSNSAVSLILIGFANAVVGKKAPTE
mgnify:CR=1 FL=1